MDEPIFTIALEVPSHFVKKNSKQILRNRRTGHHFIASSNKAQLHESWLIRQLVRTKTSHSLAFPITSPIRLQCRFFYKKNKNGKPTKRLADLSNLLQGPEDALQKAGIILDDKQIESFDGTRRITDHDKNVLEISIFPFEE